MNHNSVTRKRYFTTFFAMCAFMLVVASFLKVSLANELREAGFVPIMMEENTISKTLMPRIVEMLTAGKVISVNDGLMDIERTPKGSVHPPAVMEFALSKPVKIEIGDRVYIAYINKDQGYIAAKATVISKKKRRMRQINDDKPAYAVDVSSRLI